MKIYFILLGLVLGSFTYSSALRYLNHKKMQTRSHCPQCHHLLGPIDLIPMLSFLLLRGRCRYCDKKISFEYFYIEIINAMMYLFICLKFNSLPLVYLYSFTFTTHLYVSIIDHKITIIPDRCHLFSLLLILFFQPSLLLNIENILGLFIPSLPLLYLSLKTKGLGLGDVKLLSSIGLLVGWKMNLFVLLIASLLGSIFGIYQIFRHKQGYKRQIPFGPYIVIGSWICILFLNPFISHYFSY